MLLKMVNTRRNANRSNKSSENEVASESDLPRFTIEQPQQTPLNQPETINESEPSTSSEQTKQKPALKSLKQKIGFLYLENVA